MMLLTRRIARLQNQFPNRLRRVLNSMKNVTGGLRNTLLISRLFRIPMRRLIFFQYYIRKPLNCEGVIGLVIGTRPDCMDIEKLDLLTGLSKKYHIAVEYGIETVYNRTLERINRCHTFEETQAAIEMTAGKGIHVGGHLIFGLPGESRQEMLESASLISAMPVDSIKFHQLQIFKGTEMEKEFKEHPEDFFSPGEEEYLDFMLEYLELLNPAMVVERIAGETPPRYAVRKPWGPRYDQILVRFEKLLEKRDTWQGKRFTVIGDR